MIGRLLWLLKQWDFGGNPISLFATTSTSQKLQSFRFFIKIISSDKRFGVVNYTSAHSETHCAIHLIFEVAYDLRLSISLTKIHNHVFLSMQKVPQY